MKPDVSVSDDLASDVNSFAAANDLPVDRAYELLLVMGMETLDAVEMDAYVEEDRLVLECPACARLFDDLEEGLAHDCSE